MRKVPKAAVAKSFPAINPIRVCGVEVPPVLIKLYWLNEREEALIEHVGGMLQPYWGGALMLAAVKARFAAVAEWATHDDHLALLPPGVSDDAILSALAHAPLGYAHGRYRLWPEAFADAVKRQLRADTSRTPQCVN